MALRDLVLNNFRWKLAAVILATLVWFIIQFAIGEGFNPTQTALPDYRTYTFVRQPVMVLGNPGDTQYVRLTPSNVDVVVRSTGSALNKLTENDIRAFVTLADVPEGLQATKEVLVYVPEGVEVYRVDVEPPAIKVEKIVQPQQP